MKNQTPASKYNNIAIAWKRDDFLTIELKSTSILRRILTFF